jgi:hypothetical protein
MRNVNGSFLYGRAAGIVSFQTWALLLPMLGLSVGAGATVGCTGEPFYVAEPLTVPGDAAHDPDQGDPEAQLESGHSDGSVDAQGDSGSDRRDDESLGAESSDAVSSDLDGSGTDSGQVGEETDAPPDTAPACVSAPPGGGTCLSDGPCDPTVPCCHGCDLATCLCH